MRPGWTNLVLLTSAALAGYAAMEYVAAPVVGQSAAVEASPAAPIPTDGLVCLDPVYDFGRVDTGRPLTHVFRLKNLSNRPLRVIGTRTSCTCTGVEVTKDPVPPGGWADLIVGLDWKGRGGPQQAAVWVRTDSPTGELQTLVLRADAGSKPVALPDRIARGDRNQFLLVQGNDHASFRIESVDVPSGMELVRVDEAGAPDPGAALAGKAGRFVVKWSSPRPSSFAGGSASQTTSLVFHTNDPEVARIIVSVLQHSGE